MALPSISRCAIALFAAFFCAQSFAQDAEASPEKNLPEIQLVILKTPEPIEYRMENSMLGGFGWLVHKARNSAMSGQLTSELMGLDPKFNERLRIDVEAAINKVGIKTIAAQQISINPVKPWALNYATIETGGNALLHVYIERIGIQSRSSSATYQPFAHVVYCLVIPGKGKGCTHGDRSYYGEGYTEEGYLVYPADIADQWADEGDAHRRITSVRQALEKAVSKIATGISSEVIKQINEAQTVK